MGLNTALYSGLSGLTVNQTAIDVAGNNIANVNTTSFKASRALFESMFSIDSSSGSPPTATSGGTNPIQEGLGAAVGSIQRNFTGGSIQPTGVATDMAIQGNGFFVVQGASQGYTRNGSFTLNSDKYLVDSQGNFVMGYGADSNGNIIDGMLQRIRIPEGIMTLAEASTNVAMTGTLKADADTNYKGTIQQTQSFTTADATALTGSTLLTNLKDSSGAMFTVGSTITIQGNYKSGQGEPPAKTLDVTATTTVQDLEDMITNAFGITTDPSMNPTAGASIISDGAGGYRLQIAGDVGLTNEFEIPAGGIQINNGPRTDPLTFSYSQHASGECAYTRLKVYDSLGTTINVDLTMVKMPTTDNTGTTWQFYASSPQETGASPVLGTGTVSFGPDGKYKSSTSATLSINRDNTGAVTPLVVSLDFSTMTNESSGVYNPSTISGAADGDPASTLNGFSVGRDGTITGLFGSGMQNKLGQIALATFANNDGLVDKGNGIYTVGTNSGEATVGKPNSNGAGIINGSALEGSNVDISNEFINLITASTGFSAASRVITTSNQMLTELLGIMR